LLLSLSQHSQPTALATFAFTPVEPRTLPVNILRRLNHLASATDFICPRIAAHLLDTHPNMKMHVIRIIGADDEPRIRIPRVFVGMMHDRAFWQWMTERLLGANAM